jgi:hypothetical protein
VKVFRAPVATKQPSGRAKPFSQLGEDILKPRSDPLSLNAIKQRSSIMLASILGFIYQHSCRKYLAAVRKYQELSHWRT